MVIIISAYILVKAYCQGGSTTVTTRYIILIGKCTIVGPRPLNVDTP